jgi:molecular chaperone GrpE
MKNTEKTKPAENETSENEPPVDATPKDETAGEVSDAPEAKAPEPELTLDEQLAEMTDRWKRARADTENVRRRARLDVEEARKHGVAGLILSLLPVLDSLQRALATKPGPDGESKGEDANEKVWEGLELTEQMLLGTLSAHGITPIEASAGTPFDPTAHQALLEQPTDVQEPGTIVMELVRGYRLHDRLLREAQVTVATRQVEPEGEGTDDASGQENPGSTFGKDASDADV